jgi:hypothetical protein
MFGEDISEQIKGRTQPRVSQVLGPRLGPGKAVLGPGRPRQVLKRQLRSPWPGFMSRPYCPQQLESKVYQKVSSHESPPLNPLPSVPLWKCQEAV